MPQDEVLICRRCKVPAHTEIVENQIVSITCPSCGVVLKGDAARKVYIHCTQYSNFNKVQDVIRRSARKGGFRSKSVRHTFTTLRKPGGPFMIGRPNP